MYNLEFLKSNACMYCICMCTVQVFLRGEEAGDGFLTCAWGKGRLNLWCDNQCDWCIFNNIIVNKYFNYFLVIFEL